eukprot:765440-Hanusia_phi.AAC.3
MGGSVCRAELMVYTMMTMTMTMTMMGMAMGMGMGMAMGMGMGMEIVRCIIRMKFVKHAARDQETGCCGMSELQPEHDGGRLMC